MCAEGDMIMSLVNAMTTFTGQYYSQVSDIFRYAVRSWAAVWLAWTFVRLALNNPPDKQEAAENLLAFIVADSLLEFPSMIWQFGLYAASKAFLGSTGGQEASTLGDVVCYASRGIGNSLGPLAQAGWSDMSIGLGTRIGTLLFVVVFFVAQLFLVLKIVKNIALPFARVFVIMVLMPAVIFLTTIRSYRSVALNSIKMLMTAAMEIVIVSAVVGVMISMIIAKANSLGLPADANGVSTDIQTWFGSPNYFSIMIMLIVFYFIFDELIAVPASILSIVAGRTSMQSVMNTLQGIGDTLARKG